MTLRRKAKARATHRTTTKSAKKKLKRQRAEMRQSEPLLPVNPVTLQSAAPSVVGSVANTPMLSPRNSPKGGSPKLGPAPAPTLNLNLLGQATATVAALTKSAKRREKLR